MERLTVYYDGWCPWCVRAARWCRRLDWLGRLDLQSFRPGAEEPAGTAPPLSRERAAQAEAELLARASPSGRWYAGFGAILAIAQRLPLLWPVVPVLAVLEGVAAGPALYRAIARRRPVILPIPGACPLPHRREREGWAGRPTGIPLPDAAATAGGEGDGRDRRGGGRPTGPRPG
ncbi:thiol-disulfide oxidoreductase DCC [Thermaerobacter marianensis DSM 12885]|uniref:Thiol-disulfide oxidoreductase DCC n=1 Tax=Thermaerobacter marianensis (strain ATCC 700841 / DSM 12885 / JCM 10246 / 7p75a) TaxID=644966 RepID=E6SIL0_THEM7|nr:DUF393 domain-containing protein [Thermaerobacter marianensis]ADU50916.1 thiol-disulfide oxidoreductase DCC [Thermaerobacter marianensis DSM 12885]